MSEVHPVVRYLILCDDVETDPASPGRVTLVRVLSAIRPAEEPPYPYEYPEFCVYMDITECRGPAEGRIEVHNADTEETVFQTRTRTIPFRSNPLDIQGLFFRLRKCRFTKPGLYWVQFWYNEQMIAQQPLLLR